MEIEHKFRVDDERVFAALLALNTLGAYTLHHASAPEQQHNTYFDTPDSRLQRAGYGLRVRVLPDRRVATLKGPSSGQGGRHEREEWEAKIGDDDAPVSWPPGELRERSLRLIGDQPLVVLLTVMTTRQHIFARRAGHEVAELSLDAGTIYAAGRSEPFRELEVELRDAGTPADLDALCAALLARFLLVPDERSKLARGLKLLLQDDDRDERE